jgi:hypothetical protein
MNSGYDNLSPSELNRNLVHAGLFLVAFELVRERVVNRVKRLYRGVTFGEGMPFKSYENDVLARDNNVFEASLLYLRDYVEAINSEDLNAIQALREYRNRIAHELPHLLPNMNPAANEALLSRAREALFRLSNFWVYVEIGSDPEAIAGEDLMLLDQIIERCQKAPRARERQCG